MPIPASRTLLRLRGLAARGLTLSASWVEAHPLLSFLPLLVLYVSASLAQSSAHLLWHDELFTLYIAQAPSLRQLFDDIRLVDLNPPLSYLLSRISLSALGVSTLACRVPEIMAFAAAMFFVFCFVRRRAGVAFGLCSASLLFSSLAGELATDARPYALLLAFTALGLLAWQRAREPNLNRALTLSLLSVSAAGMLLSHIFGLLSWIALIAHELTRAYRRRRVEDWPLLLAFAGPLLVVALYPPMLRKHGVSAFPLAFQPTAEDLFDFYIHHIDREIVVLLLTALVTAVLLGRKHLHGRGTLLFTPPEWISILALLAAPGILIAYLMLSHGAFFPRYGAFASLSVAMLATALLSLWTGGDPRSALLAALLALLISGQFVSCLHGLPMLLSRRPDRASEPVPRPCQACSLSASLDPNLPLVDASGLTFLEMDHRESAETLGRVFFLTDNAAALRFANATIFNGMDIESRIFPIRAHVEVDTAFFARHPRFFVLGQYDYPEDWLLRKLVADGASVQLLGHVAGDYKDHELYLVDLLKTPASPASARRPVTAAAFPSQIENPGSRP